MLSRLNEFDSTLFGENEYLADIDFYWPKMDGDFIKLERRQVFQEPWDASWNAMIEGDWSRAIDLIDEARPEIQSELAGLSRFQRIRVVENPPSSYLQWEFMLFRVRIELGEEVLVVEASSVASFETLGVLPEVVILDSGPMYEVLYDENGLHQGGRRFDQSDVISSCRAEIELLTRLGEGFSSYFQREIEPRVSARLKLKS